MKSQKILPFILECASHFKWLIAGQFLVGIGWAINVSFSPYLLKIMLDKIPTIDANHAFAELSIPAGLYIFMGVLLNVLWRLYNYIWLNLNPGLKKLIGLKLMDKMMDHSYHFYQNQFAGSLGSKIKEVMSSVPDILNIVIMDFFSYSLALFIAIYTMNQVSPKFAIALTIWVIIYLVVSIKFSKKATKLSRQAAEVRSSVIGYIVDILGNMSSVRFFNGKASEKRNLSNKLQEYKEADQKRDWYFLKMFSFQGISFVIYHAITLFLLIWGLRSGSVTAGDFALILMLNIAIIDILWQLAEQITRFAEKAGDVAQGLEIVQSPQEIRDAADANELQLKKGEITFSKVKFHYKDSKALFDNLSVTIKPGQKVGLVGYSGSGKTSFVNLILRLFDVTAGSISIDDQDISEVTQDSLRGAIGMIPQEPALFHRSLLDNIAYGKIGSSQAEVMEAASKAHAHEFIAGLPHGYDSLVGERGIKLSGGQRQRIAIARAFLKNPPILVLDEATSQLDSVTENYIQEALELLMQGKTTIIVAHRLSTLLYMDRILVFDKGKIVEDGSHIELLEKGELYKKLWDAQVGGFLPDQAVPSL